MKMILLHYQFTVLTTAYFYISLLKYFMQGLISIYYLLLMRPPILYYHTNVSCNAKALCISIYQSNIIAAITQLSLLLLPYIEDRFLQDISTFDIMRRRGQRINLSEL